MHATFDVSNVPHRGRIRSRSRPRQRETWDLVTFCETLEVEVLLLACAVFFNQLTRSQRVRYHDDRNGVWRT